MTKKTGEISASSWFYYKEICYDARSHEPKKWPDYWPKHVGGYNKNKGKSFSLQAWRGPDDSRSLRLPDFENIQHMKVVRLSALSTGRLYPPRNIPGTHFYWSLSRPLGHVAAGRIMSMKNSNDTIGNRRI
jgi:hypothetical protein